MPEGNSWDNEKLQRRLASRLGRQVSLMQMHGGAQAEIIVSALEEIYGLFSERIKLMTLLLKAWKGVLKAKNAVDFPGFTHQAIVALEKGRFANPWKYILADESQNISPQYAVLLAALHKQNSQTTLFAAGDDWQATHRFSGAQMSSTTTFHENFSEGDRRDPDTTCRSNSRIGEVASRSIQQNPGQPKKPSDSLINEDKKAVMSSDEGHLDALLDKLSGHTKPKECILILARYYHTRSTSPEKVTTHWPKLQIDFTTIHVSKRQQADYVITAGLQEGGDGFPVVAWESIMEEVLLPSVEDFPDAEERRLIYVALTRVRHRVQALLNKKDPSLFVEILKNLDIPVARKPQETGGVYHLCNITPDGLQDNADNRGSGCQPRC